MSRIRLWLITGAAWIVGPGVGRPPGRRTLAGLNRLTGKIVWSVSRPKIANYTSPAVVRANGRDQMVLAGCNLISSFDPLTGKKLWEVDGSTEECVVTMVTDGERVFASGGYPKSHTVASWQMARARWPGRKTSVSMCRR